MRRPVCRLLVMAAVLAIFLPAATFALAAPSAQGVDVNAPSVPGQFVIKFKPGTAGATRRQVVQAEGGHFFDRVAVLDVDAAEFPALTGRADPAAAAALINRLMRNPNVEYVEPNYIYSVSYTPNDPGRSQQ